jgi:hypothetical protein
MDAKYRPSDASTAAAIMGGGPQAGNLAAHFPIAYPRLPRMTTETLQEDSYDRLTRPSPSVPQTRLDIEQSAGDATGESPSPLPLPQQTARPPYDDSAPPPLCDDRLRKLDIANWTKVPITNEAAARAISLYMQTDHPLLCHFEPQLFLSDLVNLENNYCSPLLVNALLFWATQMYTTFDRTVEGLSLQFCKEAEEVLETHRGNADADSTLVLAALQFLSLGYMGQGRDHAVLVI